MKRTQFLLIKLILLTSLSTQSFGQTLLGPDQNKFISSESNASFLKPSSLDNEADRKGFILNIGVGGARVFRKYDPDFIDLNNEFAILSDFKLGWGINNQILIYYKSSVNWFKSRKFYNEDVWYVFGNGGLGATYFFKPEVQSFFVSSSLGFSNIRTPFEEDNNGSNIGLGFTIGGGIELARHLLCQVDLMWGKTDSSGLKERTLSLGMTVNYLFY